MKKLKLIISLLLFATVVCAQDSSINLKNYRNFKLPDFKILKTPLYLKNGLYKDYAVILPANNLNVLILPLDNMPCFIPDVSSVSKIPNQKSNGSAVKIPNKIKVDTK